ncbi:MAG: N-6 DNA methylase [Candidatus Pacearchaeota archaeon]
MLLDALLILISAFLLYFLWLSYTRAFGAEYVRTPPSQRRLAIKMLKLNKNDVFYDLGAGTGSMLIEASRRVKLAIGIEIDPIRALIAYLRIKMKKIKNAKLIYGNLFKIHFSKATKLFVFLSREANEKLGNKLKQELSENAIVVSYKWPIKGLRLIERRGRLYCHKV